MVTSLLTISFDIKERMGKELRSYGANLIILPQEGEYINQFNATQPSITGFAPFLYFNAEINSKRFEFAGIDVQATRKISPWWHIDGKIPENEEVLLGVNAAVKLGLKAGDVLNLKTSSFKVSGVLDTGTSDDDKIFMPMEAAEKISGKSGATLVQLSVVGDIEEVIKSLESENYRVKKVRQVAESEKALLDKTPSPSRDQIVDAMTGNYCRCTGYEPIIRAVEESSRRMNANGGKSGGSHGDD